MQSKNVFYAAIAIGLVLLTPRVASSECGINQKAIEKDVNAIQEKYKKEFDTRRKNVEEESAQLQKDAPNPSTVEGVLNTEVEFGTTTQEITLEIPEFRIDNQKMAFNVPEMFMRRQEWKYDLPSVCMQQQCINNPPETVCDSGSRTECRGSGFLRVCYEVPYLNCHTRAGGQTCTDIPQACMKEHRTVLDIPEFRMRRQEIVVGVPVATMKKQTWKFDIPTVTVKNIKKETQKIKERSDQISEREKNASKVLSDKMKGEIKHATVGQIKSLFSCQTSEIERQREAALTEIDKNIKVLQASIESAKSVGATQMGQSLTTALNDLLSAREKTVTQFAEAIDNMSKAKRKSLDAMQ